MKRFQICRNSFRKACSKIHLIDKCLIIIMFLLLIQSSYGLFFEAVSSAESNTIDVIVRTATASIFGYFLSSNFIRHGSDEAAKKNDSSKIASIDSDSSVGFKNKVGFTDSSNTDNSVVSGSINFTPKEEPAEPYSNNHLQIIITTSIAIFCLIILTIIRNSAGPEGGHFTASAQATISQFRDLVSGCIGYLIGVPTTKTY